MSNPVLLQSTDPTLPFDLQAMQDQHGNRVPLHPADANYFVLIDGQPVLYCEDYGRRLWRVSKIPAAAMSACVELIKGLLLEKGQREICEINNQPATACKLAESFKREGFAAAGEKLITPVV